MYAPARFLSALFATALFAACSSTTASTQSSNDRPGNSGPDGVTVVSNAFVYTVDPNRPTAEAFAYDRDGIIIAVGDLDDVLEAAGPTATTLDASGAMVLPGFQDPHVHVPEAGINLEVCFLDEGLTLDEYADLIADCAAEQPDATWVRAAGASLFDLRESGDLPIEVLDEVVPDRPAVVIDNLGHAAWTNTLGLQAAGIGPDDADPQGGVFHRAPDGRLTGLLLEDAQQLVRNAAAPDDETNYRGLLASLDELAQHGVTSVSDAGGYWAQNHLVAWKRAEAEATLTVRAYNSLYVYPNLPLDKQLAEFERRFSNDAASLLRVDTAKVYVDGILDLGTALLLEPYDVAVDPNFPNGFTYFTDDQLFAYVDALHALGYRINFHAIGDAAVRLALDAVAAIDDDPGTVANRRHRTTHTYLVDPADTDRFAELGVIADFQQSEDAVATEYHEHLATFIGDRAFDLIPTARLLAAGADVSLSSDWDAGPLPPLGTIERALTREANAVPDLGTAIALSTIGAAYALGSDDRTGSIEVGKLADFVVLDRNLFDLDVTEIDETAVVATVVGGRTVHATNGFGA